MSKPFFTLALLFLSPQVFAADPIIMINGAGATFPYPIYSKWFSEYYKLNPSVQINYQSIGSGGGVQQLLKKTVLFGASDDPMKDQDMKSSDIPIVHVPTVLGAVVVAYNLPGIKESLKLTPSVISAIFMGKITKWTDPAIMAENPEVKSLAGTANENIMVVYRSDGSGTTAVFTDYLAKVSPEWQSNVGMGKAVKWPVGIGAKGNEGVAGTITKIPGTIGYIELLYARENKIRFSSIKNRMGEYVEAKTETVTAAAAGALKNMPSDFRMSITDADGKGAYPISSFTYFLVHKKMSADKGGKEFVEFLKWAMSDGQKVAQTMGYAPLPAEMIIKVKETINTVQVE